MGHDEGHGCSIRTHSINRLYERIVNSFTVFTNIVKHSLCNTTAGKALCSTRHLKPFNLKRMLKGTGEVEKSLESKFIVNH